MPLSGKQGKDSIPSSKARKRTRYGTSSKSQVATRREMDSSDGEGEGRIGAFTTSRDLAFRNGEWRERDVMETAVIVTEPRSTGKHDRDDGDSGISETAVEERLLPSAAAEASEAPAFSNTKKETVLETLIQVFIPFMISGFGMMAAGLLLDTVQVCLCVATVSASIRLSVSLALPALGCVQQHQ